jgi:hypothetical protein
MKRRQIHFRGKKMKVSLFGNLLLHIFEQFEAVDDKEYRLTSKICSKMSLHLVGRLFKKGCRGGWGANPGSCNFRLFSRHFTAEP